MVIYAIVAVAALFRLLLLLRPVQAKLADDSTYANQATLVADKGLGAFRAMAKHFRAARDANVTGQPPPSRVFYLFVLALLFRLGLPKYRAMAWVSTLSGVAATLFAAAIGWACTGPVGAAAAAILVGTSPLLLGLGRMALLDAPSVTAQLAVVAAATLGPSWWPLVAAAAAVALLMRDSARNAMPACFFLVAWLWGWNWIGASIAAAAGYLSYALVLRLASGLWPWEFPSAWKAKVLEGRKTPTWHYAARFCQGGLHRLLVDLLLVSPAVLVALWLTAAGSPFVLGAVIALGCYSLPWLDQQVRSAMIVDLLLRLAVALIAPWWMLLILVPIDGYVYWRAWWKCGVYDPTTSTLIRVFRMGE